MNSLDSLRDRVVLITGASSGIGRETALMMAPRGARLALVARRESLLKSLCHEVTAAGGEALSVAADVSQEAEATGAVTKVIAHFGRVDILVNSAGIIRPGTLASTAIQDIDDTVAVNLLAPMYMSKAVLADMLPRGEGHIVNVSSNAAKLGGTAANISYAASKHGMTGFSCSLRKEVGSRGVRVTLVEPGTTATDIASSIPDPALRERMDEHVHQEGVMAASDIAAAICYAVSQSPRVNVDEIWLTPTRQ